MKIPDEEALVKPHILRPRLAIFCGILFAFLAAPSRANAGQLYYNLSNGSGQGIDVGGLIWWANAFSTDSSSYLLGNVTLDLKGEAQARGTFSVWLYSSVSSAPGSALMTLGNSIADSSISPSAYSPYTYDGGGYALAANTMYWIVVGGTSYFEDVDWEYSRDTTITSVGPGAHASSTDGGSTWFAHALSDGFWPMVMEVDADSGDSATPEPGTFLPVLAGAAGLAALRLRMRWSCREPK